MRSCSRSNRNTNAAIRNGSVYGWRALAASFALLSMTSPASPAAAEEPAAIPVAPSFTATPDANVTFSPFLASAPRQDELRDGSLIHGFSRSFAPRWKASYGLGLVEETNLTSSILRYDQTLGYGTRSDRAQRETWRHFLGVEYSPFRSFSVLGGIAKSGGNNRASFSPTGYEKLRINAGLRWSFAENWGVDGSFSFIPTGASRLPNDTFYVPGMGSSDPTYFLSLSVSRRF